MNFSFEIDIRLTGESWWSIHPVALERMDAGADEIRRLRCVVVMATIPFNNFILTIVERTSSGNDDEYDTENDQRR